MRRGAIVCFSPKSWTQLIDSTSYSPCVQQLRSGLVTRADPALQNALRFIKILPIMVKVGD
jgi:hypothetical protein